MANLASTNRGTYVGATEGLTRDMTSRAVREAWSGPPSSPPIHRVPARQPEFLGYQLASHSPLFDPNSVTPKSRKPPAYWTPG